MNFITENFSDILFLTYARIGHVPEHPTNGKLLWHFDCLGELTDKFIDGEPYYNPVDHEEFDGAVIAAPTEIAAVRQLCQVLGRSGCRRNYNWTVELIGQALQEYEDDVVLMSNTGA